MAKLFLSYAREDQKLIEPIAHLLEGAGHSVWWDRRIFGGSDFSLEIARELDSAEVVIVGWSAASVASHWVKDEAAEGRNRNRLVPLFLDGTPPPLGFRQIHGIDFTGWDGRGSPAALDDLLRSIDLVAGSADLEPPAKAAASPPQAASAAPGSQAVPAASARPSWRTPMLVIGSVLLIAVALLLVLVLAPRWSADPSPADVPPAEARSDTGAAAATPEPAAPKAGGGGIDGRWLMSWNVNGSPYRGTLTANGANARIELEAATSMGRQSVRQDCTIAGGGPIQITCHSAEVLSGPQGYMADSFTFERRGDVLSGTTSDPFGLISAPVTARRE